MATVDERYFRPTQMGVLIGPLRHTLGADKLAECVSKLLKSVGIKEADISRILLNTQVGYAKVELYTKESEDFAVKIFKEVRTIMSLYDLRHLTTDPENFRVERIVPKPAEMKMLTGFSDIMVHKEHESTNRVSAYNPLPGSKSTLFKQSEAVDNSMLAGDTSFHLISPSQSSSSSLSPVAFENLTEEDSMRTIKVDATTSISGLPAISTKQTTSQRAEKIKPAMICAKTSTPSIEPSFYPGANFYYWKQVLEWMDTRRHFDDGKTLMYDLRSFRTDIGELICAFLNSNGGAVYYGVKKDGHVQGIYFSHNYEDAVRLDIDSQVKLIEPTVPTSAYYVNFAKVMSEEGVLVRDLKVLEVKVKTPVGKGVLYKYKSVAYIWKNNQVQERPRVKEPQQPGQSS